MFTYRCPVCNVGVNRFKKAAEQGSQYSSLQALKTAAKAAKKAAPKGTPKPRELLKQRAIDAAREKDSGKSKGWF